MSPFYFSLKLISEKNIIFIIMRKKIIQKKHYVSPECISEEVAFESFMQTSGGKTDPVDGGDDELSKRGFFEWED